MYLLIIILKKSEFMAAQRARPILLNERFLVIITFPYSTCIRSFFGSSILTSLFIVKCFIGLVSVIFLQYIANVTHRTFEIVPKNRDPANIIFFLIISVIKNVERASTARARARVPRLPRARYVIRSE